MFTDEDRMLMRQDYFTMSIEGDSVFEFISQNGDWWMVIQLERYMTKKELAAGKPKRRFYRLLHRHADADDYHEHGEYLSVLDAVLEVINHDDYRLHNKGRTHFDELLESYGGRFCYG